MFALGPVQQIVFQLEITVAGEIGRHVQHHFCKTPKRAFKRRNLRIKRVEIIYRTVVASRPGEPEGTVASVRARIDVGAHPVVVARLQRRTQFRLDVASRTAVVHKSKFRVSIRFVRLNDDDRGRIALINRQIILSVLYLFEFFLNRQVLHKFDHELN